MLELVGFLWVTVYVMDLFMNAVSSLPKTQKRTELSPWLVNLKILYWRTAVHSFTLKPEKAFSDLMLLLCIILTAWNSLNWPIEDSIFKAIMTPMITCSGCCLRVRVWHVDFPLILCLLEQPYGVKCMVKWEKLRLLLCTPSITNVGRNSFLINSFSSFLWLLEVPRFCSFVPLFLRTKRYKIHNCERKRLQGLMLYDKVLSGQCLVIHLCTCLKFCMQIWKFWWGWEFYRHLQLRL